MENPEVEIKENAPAPKKQRGGDIRKAQALAIQKLKERSEEKKKLDELKRLQEENNKLLIEKELEKEREMQAKLVAPKKPKKPKREPTPPAESESESDSETESEEEEPKRPSKRSVPAAARRVIEDPNALVRAEYERRMQLMKNSYLRGSIQAQRDLFG